MSAKITWGSWWDLIAEKRTFYDTDTARTESAVVEKHIRPHWGNVPLNQIKRKSIRDWIETQLQVRAGMSPAYVHKIYGVFAISIKRAVTDEVLDASPCVDIVLPKVPKRPKPYMSTGSADAIGEMLRADYADALEFGLETGLRPGELCGLHADRLELDRGWMLVAEVLVERRVMIRPFPKDKDTRMVPLTDRAIEIARRRLDGRDQFAGCGVPHTDGSRCGGVLVFLTLRGNVMRPDTFRLNMKRAAEKARVAVRSPYSIRRGWATRAAEGGLDAFQIAEILGHATLEQAQEYVQQTPMARMKLTTAMTKYPQLTVLQGGMGQKTDAGADAGADLSRTMSDDVCHGEAEMGS